ncbi:MAG: hypothetical protein HOY71_18970 [Nonomuraea sp.]|nr:hypothetical protein [Nonomuraea sp.]
MRRSVIVAALILAAAGCGEGTTQQSAVAGPAKTQAATVCKAVKLGPVTRCENFYTDYWPTLNANLDALYKQAKQIDGGRLVVWDWYELSPDVIKAFTTRFPGLKVKTRGLTYNLSSAIISAQATGERNTDVVSGSITSITAMYDQGYWEKVDWTRFGVPKEWLTVGAPEMLPDSLNGPLVRYNTKKVDKVPDTWDAFTSPEWNGKLTMAGYDSQVFTGSGMTSGADKMVQLIKDLKPAMTLTDNPTPLLAGGDKPVQFGGPLYDANPNLAVAPVQTENMYLQFSGVNAYGTNKPAAQLFLLWNAYDPDWLKTRMTDKRFLTEQTPFPGLPKSVFDQASPLVKRNQDALFQAIDKGWAIFETRDNRDQYNKLIKAAQSAIEAK